MKNILLKLFLLLLAGMLFIPAQLKAANTTSTDGVTFTAITPTVKAPVKKTVVTPVHNHHQPAQLTLWGIFLAGITGGFAALLMPCIFPMLPLTVSFFTKNGSEKTSAVGKASVYGLSIIVIYVVLGLLVTVIFGADALNNLATNGIFNFGFFLLIVVFAASFLGAFEINLPSSWVNKMDANADRGGILGLFFMAATLSLVSFSCTGPIIGYLLVQAATSGALMGPAIGMFGFSFALAIPFTLFAMFPGLLRSLPKSGGWLNSVKVTLGFLELALSLKFLSNVDLAYHWHWFDREVFLVLWIIIFALMGLHLLGKLTLAHDSPFVHLSVLRLFLAIVVLAFALYMVPGLWGAPLRSISAFLPPQATQDFDLYSPGGQTGVARSTPDNAAPHKYTALFDKPKGFDPFFEYDEGLAYALKVHKPVMIDFTGHACVNCRKMEATVWVDKQVYRRINEDYVLIQLYVDDKTDLPASEQSTTPEGRHIKTIGNKWSYMQTAKFDANSQPFYVLLNPASGQPLVAPQGADFDAISYLKYLDSGLDAFKALAR